DRGRSPHRPGAVVHGVVGYRPRGDGGGERKGAGLDTAKHEDGDESKPRHPQGTVRAGVLPEVATGGELYLGGGPADSTRRPRHWRGGERRRRGARRRERAGH